MPESAQPVRIIVVDDHALFREGVTRLLAAEPGFEVVGSVASTDEADAFLRSNSADIVLLDFDFGVTNCTQFVYAANQAGFRGRILLVTAGLRENQAAELIRLGIAGIFLKHNAPTLLAQAIRHVANGEVWFEQQFLRSVMTAASSPPPTIREPLTERERQVLVHVFEGLPNREIAERLAISETSVKAALQQLFAKTGVRTRSQLVRVVLEKYKDLL
jgi:two-component system, NarL family, nitrate/nitrite response regulator NarL